MRRLWMGISEVNCICLCNGHKCGGVSIWEVGSCDGLANYPFKVWDISTTFVFMQV
jgi:hypothetical protein